MTSNYLIKFMSVVSRLYLRLSLTFKVFPTYSFFHFCLSFWLFQESQQTLSVFELLSIVSDAINQGKQPRHWQFRRAAHARYKNWTHMCGIGASDSTNKGGIRRISPVISTFTSGMSSKINKCFTKTTLTSQASRFRITTIATLF